MIEPEILLVELRQMLANLEQRGIKTEIDFPSFSNSFIVAMNIANKNIVEILEREVTKYGTGAHIVIPQKHLYKKAIIIIANKKNH